MDNDFLKIKELNQQLDESIRSAYEEINQQLLRTEELLNKRGEVQEEKKPIVEDMEIIDLDKEDLKKPILNQELLRKSIEKSVKPNVFVSDKRKTVKANVKKYAFITAATTILMTSVSAYAINNHYQNKQYVENIKEYKEEIYNPNTTYDGVQYSEALGEKVPIHNHDWKSMIEEIHTKYENPVTAFYMYFYTLDDYCKKNNLNIVLNEINLYYGTDFHSLEDVYTYANVSDYKDLENYVKNDLSRLNEGELSDGENRSSNLGR